jgi:restriction endonuclease S subunit
LITESFDGAIPTKGIVLVSINGNQSVDHDYLKSWLLSGVLKIELERLQIGSHMATVKMSDLKQVRVPIPDISIQKQLIKAVVDARESLEILSDLAHQSNRLLSLQNDLLIANLNQINQK